MPEALVTTRQSLVQKFANKYSIEPDKLMTILKQTAFKVQTGEVSNEQMAALLVVSDQYGLNPFTREIFAFEDRYKGIVPVVSVDGWARIINDHEQFDGMEFVVPDEEVKVPHGGKSGFAWMECVIYRKDRTHPIRVREYLEEVYQPPRGQNQTPGPWQSHPKRMHRHKCMIQCARLAFGFSGIYDDDEAERIIQGQTLDGMATRVPTERSATARMQDALITRDKTPEAKPAAPVGDKPEPMAPPSMETIALVIDAMEHTTDSMTQAFNLLNAHEIPEEKKALMFLWNNRVRSLKGIAPVDDKDPGDGQSAPAVEVVREPVQGEAREPGPTQKERGSAQRLSNAKKQLAGAPDLEVVNEVLDLCRSYEWTKEQQQQIDEFAQAARDRLIGEGA